MFPRCSKSIAFSKVGSPSILNHCQDFRVSQRISCDLNDFQVLSETFFGFQHNLPIRSKTFRLFLSAFLIPVFPGVLRAFSETSRVSQIFPVFCQIFWFPLRFSGVLWDFAVFSKISSSPWDFLVFFDIFSFSLRFDIWKYSGLNSIRPKSCCKSPFIF